MQKFPQPIVLSSLDYEGIAQDLELKNGQMKLDDFERMMRKQLKHYAQARLSSMSEFWTITEKDFTTIGTLKHILMEQINIKDHLNSLAASSGPARPGSWQFSAGADGGLDTRLLEGMGCEDSYTGDVNDEWMAKAQELMHNQNNQMLVLLRNMISSRKGPSRAREREQDIVKSARHPYSKSANAGAGAPKSDDLDRIQNSEIAVSVEGLDRKSSFDGLSAPKSTKFVSTQEALRGSMKKKAPNSSRKPLGRSISPKRRVDTGAQGHADEASGAELEENGKEMDPAISPAGVKATQRSERGREKKELQVQSDEHEHNPQDGSVKGAGTYLGAEEDEETAAALGETPADVPPVRSRASGAAPQSAASFKQRRGKANRAAGSGPAGGEQRFSTRSESWSDGARPASAVSNGAAPAAGSRKELFPGDVPAESSAGSTNQARLSGPGRDRGESGVDGGRLGRTMLSFREGQGEAGASAAVQPNNLTVQLAFQVGDSLGYPTAPSD